MLSYVVPYKGCNFLSPNGYPHILTFSTVNNALLRGFINYEFSQIQCSALAGL